MVQMNGRKWGDDLAPPDFFDPVIEAYKKDVDQTLLIENLRRTVEQRIKRAQQFHEGIDELRRAGQAMRAAETAAAAGRKA